MITDSQFIELLKEETKKEKMVTFVADFNVTIDRYSELHDLAKAHGIKVIRMINEEIMVDRDRTAHR